MSAKGVIFLRILVLSDSHGDYFTMQKAIKAQPSAEVVVYLGDGYRDFERCKPLLEGKRIYAVKGNNDDCDYPCNQIITVGGVKIYITHGNSEYVGFSLGKIIGIARENDCTIALHGHTHVQNETCYDGVRVFCPGAIKSNEYGVIDIIDGGVICIGIKVK